MIKEKNTLYVIHNGCLNMAYDVNIIKESLKRKGYRITHNPDESKEIIIAGCGSRSVWVNEAINIVRTLINNDSNKKIIFTGCASQIDQKQILFKLKCLYLFSW